MNGDLISRQAVLDKAYELDLSDTGYDIQIWVVDVDEVEKLPAAEPSTTILKVEVSAEEAMEIVKNKLSNYFDKLWKTAYERGKAEAHPKKGKWIVHKSPDEYHCGLVECPFCRTELIAEPNEYCFCPNCGAKMMEDDMR